ncbi:LexA family protein [Herbaspirillum huttiense]|uniref:LexA family protein n=1 Tax=Herbaspirillum huttiense TaxID=863372 RepID=UPI0035C6F7CB
MNQYLVDRVACTFLFDVAGWSMSGAHIVEGDKVVVDRSISPQPGHIVVVIVNGEFTIRAPLAVPCMFSWRRIASSWTNHNTTTVAPCHCPSQPMICG